MMGQCRIGKLTLVQRLVLAGLSQCTIPQVISDSLGDLTDSILVTCPQTSWAFRTRIVFSVLLI